MKPTNTRALCLPPLSGDSATRPWESIRDSSVSLIKSSTKKVYPDESLLSFGLKPRFSQDKLQQLSNSSLVLSTQQRLFHLPIQYFESQLYNCTRTHLEVLGGKPLSLSALQDIHPVCALKRYEPYLSVGEINALNLGLEDCMDRNPAGYTEYKLIRSMMELTAGLIIHLGIYHRNKYQYRQQQRVMHVKTLDLVGMNAEIESLETLWMAVSAQEGPLEQILSETTKQLAMVVVSATETLFAFALKMNATDFRSQPQIDGYLVGKDPKLREFIHVPPDYPPSVPVYQQLSFPSSCFSYCFKSRSRRNLDSLRSLLLDQDVAFRAFEESLLANFLL